jgi:hypothetical protein
MDYKKKKKKLITFYQNFIFEIEKWKKKIVNIQCGTDSYSFFFFFYFLFSFFYFPSLSLIMLAP